jgi:hypothetical protein
VLCDCNAGDGGFTFLVAGLGKFNNDGFIDGSIGASNVGGFVRFGQNVFMTDGTSVTADRVKIGGATSVFDVTTNRLYPTPESIIRGTLTEGGLAVPLADAACTLPAFTCGGPDVTVPPLTVQTSLPPGTYGNLFIGDGAVLRLPDFGEYTFCSMKVGNNGALRPSQQVTINVSGDVRIGSGALLVSDANAPFIFNVGGTKFRISQGAVVNAKITAPFAKIKIQRDGTIDGCTCSDAIKTDKHTALLCDGMPVP